VTLPFERALVTVVFLCAGKAILPGGVTRNGAFDDVKVHGACAGRVSTPLKH
jgi:hypothetical protein